MSDQVLFSTKTHEYKVWYEHWWIAWMVAVTKNISYSLLFLIRNATKWSKVQNMKSFIHYH